MVSDGFGWFSVLIVTVTSKQKKINENYILNIALFINNYVEILAEITGVSYFLRVYN